MWSDDFLNPANTYASNFLKNQYSGTKVHFFIIYQCSTRHGYTTLGALINGLGDVTGGAKAVSRVSGEFEGDLKDFSEISGVFQRIL